MRQLLDVLRGGDDAANGAASRASPTSTAWSPASAPPASTWSSAAPARRPRSPGRSACPATASSRRRSPTSPATRRRPRRRSPSRSTRAPSGSWSTTPARRAGTAAGGRAGSTSAWQERVAALRRDARRGAGRRRGGFDVVAELPCWPTVTVARSVIVDDQPLMRHGAAHDPRRPRDRTVVGEAGDGDEASPRCGRSARRRADGRADARARRARGDRRAIVASVPESRVLVLTTFDHDEYLDGALRAGAAGFLLKNATPEDLVAPSERVAAGDGGARPGGGRAGHGPLRAAAPVPTVPRGGRPPHRAGEGRAAAAVPRADQRRDRRRSSAWARRRRRPTSRRSSPSSASATASRGDRRLRVRLHRCPARRRFLNFALT